MILRFISGKYESAEFPLSRSPIRIGNDPDFDMVLHDDTVDRAHARIEVDGGKVWLEDLGSATGTYVNDRRVGRVALAPGDRIIIGRHVMELR